MSRLVPNQILHGDSRVVLKTLPAASVDSVVTDPPAGIAFMAKEWDTPNVANHKGHVAEHRRARTAFVADMTEVFVECHRVLKPGGHMFVWAIPRTSHWTAWALEEAGFEIRDCVYHVFGQGFPKSLNVSKAIDKTKGATREVVGTRKGKGGQNGNLLMRPEGGDSPDAKGCGAYGVGVVQTDIDIPVTAPATPEAQKWDGWGTALKPSTECWWLCRKPIETQNVAANVLKHGTGAINIDGCRVAGTAQVPGSIRASRRFDDRGDRPELVEPPSPNAAGRWPANLMLSHSEGCRQIGETEVPAPVINRFTDGMKPFGEGAGHPYESSGGGTETIPVYECADGCPVKALDEQSGVTGGGPQTLNSEVDRTAISTTAHNPREPNQSASLANYGDAGGASRYFQTFDPKGRWPANMVLSHAPGCVRHGVKKVKGGNDPRRSDGTVNHGGEVYGGNLSGGAVHASEHAGFSDAEGLETVEDWECGPGCPVAEIDRQGQDMGVHPAGSPLPAQEKWDMAETTPSYSGGFSGPSGMRYGDEGGTSRFFQNFEPDVPFFYTAKAAKSEKEDGLDETADGKRQNTHPCLHPDALVMTEKGYRPIKDIRVGDPVLAADGSFHDVEAVTRHPYTSEALVEIRVMGTSFTSLVSDNHPYLIWRPTRERNAIVGGEVLWLRAEQVTKGDYTMTPIVQRGHPEWEPPRPDDTDFWFIVGLYLAEGCPHSTKNEENYYPSFSLHEDETALIERIKMYVAPTNIGVYPKKNYDGVLSKGVQVVAFDLELGGLCVRLCGRGAATKSIDPSVWNLPEESLRAFVEGYFAGDGGVVRTYLQAKSVSQDLASQMRFLGEMLGYKVELQCVPAEPGHIGEREFKSTSPVHVLRMMERNRTISHRKPSRPTVLEHEGGVFTLAYVKEVQRVPYVGDVLNLSVEGSHTFQTAVGMSHNTVKPISLMRYLVKMVTPPGGVVLDPFAGSGSTLIAAVQEGMQFVGIEREAEYVKIAEARVGVVAAREAAVRSERDTFEMMMNLGDEDE